MRAVTRELAAAVQWASRATLSRPYLPALGGLHLRADDGWIEVVGTDINTVARATVEADANPESVLVPARPLADFLAKVGGDSTVTLDVHDDRVEVATADGRIGLRLLDTEDWPDRLPHVGDPIEAKGLADALAAALRCAQSDENLRGHGVRLQPSDSGMEVVGGNDHYATLRTLDVNVSHPVTLPLAVAQIAAKADASAVAIDEHSATLHCGEHRSISTVGLNDSWPSFRAIKQQRIDGHEPVAEIAVAVDALTRAVDIAAVTAKDTSSGKQLRLHASDDGVVLAVAEGDDGDGDAQCDAEVDGDVTLHVGSKVLLNTARAVADDDGMVTLRPTGEWDPMLLKPTAPVDDLERWAIAMPIRLA